MNRTHAMIDVGGRMGSGAFETDMEIRHIGEGLLDHSLPKKDWTHAAHCAAAIYFMLERPDLEASLRMPVIIRSYNLAKGVQNTQSGGYHETVTRLYLKTIEQFLSVVDDDMTLCEIVNLFLRSPFSKLDYLSLFYSKDRLFSQEARRRFIEPDIRPFPGAARRSF